MSLSPSVSSEVAPPGCGTMLLPALFVKASTKLVTVVVPFGVCVAPQRELGVPAETRGIRAGHQQGVQPPAAGDRVGGLRDGDALIAGGAGKGAEGEVADHPAVSDMVIQDEGIALVVGAAGRAVA